MDLISLVGVGVLAIALAAWPLLRRPAARGEFVVLRRDSNTDSVARLVRRVCAFAFCGLPYGAVLLLIGMAVPTDPPTPLRDLLMFALLASLIAGVGMSWLLYPFVVGLLAPSPADPESRPAYVPRVVLALTSELRSVVRGFDGLWQVCWTRRASFQNLSPEWRVPLGAALALSLFSLSGVIFVLELVAVFYAAYLYALPAYLPFLISEDELVTLNERPFLIAFGVALLALNDVLMRMRDWASRRSRAFSSSVALVVTDVVLLTTLLLLSDEHPNAERLSVGGAVFVGVVVAVEALLFVDLGHALVSAQVAGRRTTPPLRPDMGLLVAGQRSRTRLAGARRRARIELDGVSPFSPRGLARLARAALTAVVGYLTEEGRQPRPTLGAEPVIDAETGVDVEESLRLNPGKSSEL